MSFICICCGQERQRAVIHHDHIKDLLSIADLFYNPNLSKKRDFTRFIRFPDSEICDNCNSTEANMKIKFLQNEGVFSTFFSFNVDEIKKFITGEDRKEYYEKIYKARKSDIRRISSIMMDWAIDISCVYNYDEDFDYSQKPTTYSRLRSSMLLRKYTRTRFPTVGGNKPKGGAGYWNLYDYEKSIIKILLRPLSLRNPECIFCKRNYIDLCFRKIKGRVSEISTTDCFSLDLRSILCCSQCRVVLQRESEKHEYCEEIPCVTHCIIYSQEILQDWQYPVIKYGKSGYETDPSKFVDLFNDLIFFTPKESVSDLQSRSYHEFRIKDVYRKKYDIFSQR